MSLPSKKFKVAAVQAAPYQMNTQATVEKACGLIEEASASNVRLIVFPELFVPGYPHVAPMRSGDEPSIPRTSEGKSWLDYWTDFTRAAIRVPGGDQKTVGGTLPSLEPPEERKPAAKDSGKRGRGTAGRKGPARRSRS